MSRKSYYLLFAMLVINAVFNARFQLHYDEAYYWVWGQNLSLSYFDHPPMVAYMIRLASIFGHSEFWVRAPALLCSFFTIIVLYKLSLQMFGAITAEITLILAFSMPIIEATAFIITPDSPLLLFWALTLYCFYMGIFEQRRLYLYFAGVCGGLAFLSKYTAVLLFPGLLLFLITSPYHRNILKHKDIYVSFMIVILMSTPVIIWNYQHDWVSFVYQIGHGISANANLNLSSVGDYIGGQIAISNPFIFFAAAYYILRNMNSIWLYPKLTFLLCPVFFGFIFFLGCSTTKHMEANWAGPIYLSLIIFVAYFLVINRKWWVYKASFIFICIIISLTKMPVKFTPRALHNKIPGLNIFFGNKELLGYVSPYIHPNTIVLTCDYGNASRIWFYLGVRTYVLSQLPFSGSYRYWQQLDISKVKDAIYICGGKDDKALEYLGLYFTDVRLLKKAFFSNVITDNVLYIFKVSK